MPGDKNNKRKGGQNDKDNDKTRQEIEKEYKKYNGGMCGSFETCKKCGKVRSSIEWTISNETCTKCDNKQ